MRPLKSNLTRQALSGWQQGVTPADNQRLNIDGKECLKALGIVGHPPTATSVLQHNPRDGSNSSDSNSKNSN